MKYLIILFVLLNVFLNSFSQEPLMPELPEQDSLEMEHEMNIMFPAKIFMPEFSELIQENNHLPGFDFKLDLDDKSNYFLSETLASPWNMNGIYPGSFGLPMVPFFRNREVLSGAVHPLGENFTLGGYSYGANSVFSAPFPHQNMNNFDVRGSTLFMQYKVSKNFKIETRFNVTRSPGF